MNPPRWLAPPGRIARRLWCSAAILIGADAANAQAPAPPASAAAAPARLILTVTDTSGGVIPSATVTLIGIEAATSASTIEPATTSPQGLATILGLAPGRYTIHAEFQGLEPSTMPDVRLRSGDTRLTIVLALPRLQDAVTVQVDRQAVSADRNQTFGSALTREQIEALSDDPDEMRRQLAEVAGFDPTIRVDSFEGAALPAKAQIKSIHITRDAFAAENHSAGALFIDIITQPGIGPIRGGLNFRLRDGSLSGRSPFVERKGPEQSQNYFGNIGGSLSRERTSFSLSMQGTHSYDTPILNAALPDGTVSATLLRRVPREQVFTSALLDHAVTKDQTLRISFNQSRFSSSNLGVGAYDLPERSFSTDDTSYSIRVQEVGPLGRRFFTNTRVMIGWSDNNAKSLVEQPTIVVTDAFTSGGQQRAGGRHARQLNIGSDLDYVRGIHSYRAGLLLDGATYRSDDRTNYLGTYTFETLDDYEAGRPRSYTRRVGDPNVEYTYLTSSFYLQDDIRVRRNLTLSPGLRYERVLHVGDGDNLAPRFGVTWSPFRSGRTSLRASAGMFYDWMSANTYEQTLRVDGVRQREINVLDPVFDPDGLNPGDVGASPPANKYLLGDQLELATYRRLSLGVDQTINSRLRVSMTYAFMRGVSWWRGSNLNAPVDGVRPDPAFANIVEVVSDGRSLQHSFSAFFSYNLARVPAAPTPLLNGAGVPLPPPPPGASNAVAANARFDWRRMNFSGNYGYGRYFTNAAEGPFTLPASGTVEGEWGPALSDVRHRINLNATSTQLRNLNVNVNLNYGSAPPYNIRTGRDDNGDLVFNDRPAGVGRNSARGADQLTVNSNFVYSIAFGGTRVNLPPGVQIIGTGGGAPTVNVVAPQAAARYRLQFILSAQNLTNRDNYGGFSGVMTSHFFGEATTVINPRKIDFGLGFSF